MTSPSLRLRAVLCAALACGVLDIIAAGLAYGALVYVAMHWGVIPLAALFRTLYLPDATVRFLPFNFTAFVVHLVFVGLPIALVVRHFLRR